MWRALIPALLMTLAQSATADGMPAFPGAEGFGAASIGGRGGRVIEVTNLADSGPGSFRDAVAAAGPRTVVFRVAGIIDVKKRIDIVEPFLTIAGQTAPGGGITLRGTPEGGGQMLRIRTHDLIIRHLRIRSGLHGTPGRGQVNVSLDPLPPTGRRGGDVCNIMLDHLSVSWSLDENLAIFRNVPVENGVPAADYPRVYNISVQNCLIAEGLYPHSTGLQAGGERVMREGRSIFNGGMGVYNVSIHRNLFANTSHRNPGLGIASAQIINNVMYNWSSKCAETHDAMRVDWIGNYFKPGPLSDPEHLIVHNHFFKGFPQHPFQAPSIYMQGNLNPARPAQRDWEMYEIHYAKQPLPQHWRRERPLEQGQYPVKISPAGEVYASLLEQVGANRRLNAAGAGVQNRDAADARIIHDVQTGAGHGSLHDGQRVHFTSPDEVGGYPGIEPGMAYADEDRDGMPDQWEQRHRLSDPARDEDGDGYTNLEEFLNADDPRAGR